MKGNKATSRCSKCHNKKHLSRHHIYPVIFYGHGRERVWLCRHCHDVLENYIFIAEGSSGKPNRVKKCREFYYDMLIDFLDGEEIQWVV